MGGEPVPLPGETSMGERKALSGPFCPLSAFLLLTWGRDMRLSVQQPSPGPQGRAPATAPAWSLAWPGLAASGPSVSLGEVLLRPLLFRVWAAHWPHQALSAPHTWQSESAFRHRPRVGWQRALSVFYGIPSRQRRVRCWFSWGMSCLCESGLSASFLAHATEILRIKFQGF